MEGQPILDTTIITRLLQRPSGRQLLALYVEEASQLLEGLQSAVVQFDPQAIRDTAHSLKSSSAYVGALQVNSLSSDLELLGRNEELEMAESLLRQLEMAFEHVKKEIRGVIA